MAKFTAKERRAHATGVANGTIPVKADSKYTVAEQRAYNAGVRDEANARNMAYLLGKHSPLSAEEKKALKAKQKARNAEYKAKRAKAKKTKK